MQQQYPRVVGPVDQSVADLVFPANEAMSIVLLPLFCCTWAGPNSSPQYYVDYFGVKCTRLEQYVVIFSHPPEDKKKNK